ncbi:DUF2284 domain-containing protein [Desulfovirgula thermocuniculi]|uniref:DUF2284 domain-containing protein n=1 Tax=Desulfovirgula thermocuniculi TaxID=348842 RepID=UPI00146F97D1|nr:DUF2284 domain-containing protein [Desulfovirgula thermocuniculi]
MGVGNCTGGGGAEAILDICRGHWAAWALFAAVELGIFDALARGAAGPGGCAQGPVGLTPSQVAAALGTHPEATARLLRALTALGLVEKAGEGYRNSPAADRHLVRGRETYLGHAVRHFANLAEGWSRLGEAVRCGCPTGFEAVEKSEYRERLRDYILAMRDYAALKAGRLAAALDLCRCRRFLDLGGGPGVYTAALLKRQPRARAVLMDLPPVLELAGEILRGYGVAERVELLAGDFTMDDLGEGLYDLVLLSNVVHIYDPATNENLVRRVWRALRPGGQIAVHDYVLTENPAPEAALFDLNMLVGTVTGRVYGAKEMESWLESAGFREIRHHPFTPGSVLLVGEKPGDGGGEGEEDLCVGARPLPLPELLEELCRLAREAGALGVKAVDTATVAVAPWVRWKCQYGCPYYGRSLTCPPFSPRPEETAAVLRCYRRGLLFWAEESWQVRYLAARLERRAFRAGYYRAFGLGAGPCGLCAPCNVPGPCRRPGEARPSMEACGIDVFRTAANNGLVLAPQEDFRNTCPRVGLLLVE